MKYFAIIISTFFYAGYLPISGTSTSLIVLLISWLIFYLSSWTFEILNIIWVFGIIFGFFLGVYTSTYMVIKVLKKKDPSEVVIDEVIGMMISLLPLLFFTKMQENYILYGIIAFLSFRFFDIVKPSLIGKSEQLKEGWGIMLDDVLSGVATVIATGIIYILIVIW